MELTELKDLTNKILHCRDHMYNTLEGNKEDYLNIAIMAGLKSAFNTGIRRANSKIKDA